LPVGAGDGAIQTMNGDSPIVAQGLGHRYRRRSPWALRGVDLEIPAGSIVALVGPNGAGKSTFIRLCLGFEVPDEGTVRVFGWAPHRDRTRAVGAIGYVPQSISLWRGLTVDEHFSLARAARPSFDVAYARRLVGSVGIESRAVVQELSGGQQAQVALALALASRAPLLLLDEPLAGLDPLARRDFLVMLREHTRREGATALLSSHLISDLEPVATWLLVLAGGRLVLSGFVDEIRNRHAVVSHGGEAGLGRFRDVTGEELTLVARENQNDRATLEEIVLGYLAAHRPTDSGNRR
jgi:ABC-2 type transport system ATP-binding protein